MENLITQKQMDYIIKLDSNKTAEMLKGLSIKEASIMICKLKKQPKQKEYEHGYSKTWKEIDELGKYFYIYHRV